MHILALAMIAGLGVSGVALADNQPAADAAGAQARAVSAADMKTRLDQLGYDIRHLRTGELRYEAAMVDRASGGAVRATFDRTSGELIAAKLAGDDREARERKQARDGKETRERREMREQQERRERGDAHKHRESRERDNRSSDD
jgi:hypothetical protein